MRRLTHQIPLSIIAIFISFTVLGVFVPAATAYAVPETVVEAEILEVSQYPDATTVSGTAYAVAAGTNTPKTVNEMKMAIILNGI